MAFWDTFFGGGGSPAAGGTGAATGADVGGMTGIDQASYPAGSELSSPDVSPPQRQGLLAMLAQYGSKLRQPQQGAAGQSLAPVANSQGAGTPASSAIPYDSQAPDEMAKAQAAWKEQQMWEGMAQNVGKTVSMLYGGGAASSI